MSDGPSRQGRAHVESPAQPGSGVGSDAVQRRRLGLLVKVAASAGDFSPKLSRAVARSTDAEVRVMNDLVERGMTIPALVSVLQGAHVIVGDEDLYDRWIFPTSRRRMSSHHRGIDKGRTPDYGLDGPLVRESLHGKAEVGTWVQLERTKATFQWGKMPTWHDVVHIRDYVVYRITGKNVGPWGLSAHVDTRPMLLRPPNATSSRGAGRALAAFADRPQTPGRGPASTGLLRPTVAPVGPAGDLFSAPQAAHPAELLPAAPNQPDLGSGLFGTLSIVRATAPLRAAVIARLDRAARPVGFEDVHGPMQPVGVRVGDAVITVAAHVWRSPSQPPVFPGIDQEQT